MPKGSKPGERRGGRQKGTPNRKNASLIKAVEVSGITPLEYLLHVMRAPIPEDASALVQVALINQRFEAAKAAAPYVHPRLAAVQVSGEIEHQHVARMPAVEEGADTWAKRYAPTSLPAPSGRQ